MFTDQQNREMARMAIEFGLTDCPCGQPDCKAHLAIKEELARQGRRPEPNGSKKAREFIQSLMGDNNPVTQAAQSRAKKMVDEGATDCHCGQPDCPLGQAIREEVKHRKSDEHASTPGLFEQLFGGQFLHDLGRKHQPQDFDDRNQTLVDVDALRVMMVELSQSEEFRRGLGDAIAYALDEYERQRHDRALTTRLWRNVLKPILLGGARVLLIALSFIINIVKEPFAFALAFSDWRRLEEKFDRSADALAQITRITGKPMSQTEARSEIFKRLTPGSKLGLRLGRWMSQFRLPKVPNFRK